MKILVFVLMWLSMTLAIAQAAVLMMLTIPVVFVWLWQLCEDCDHRPTQPRQEPHLDFRDQFDT